jgi:hypothetical protein
MPVAIECSGAGEAIKRRQRHYGLAVCLTPLESACRSPRPVAPAPISALDRRSRQHWARFGTLPGIGCAAERLLQSVCCRRTFCSRAMVQAGRCRDIINGVVGPLGFRAIGASQIDVDDCLRQLFTPLLTYVKWFEFHRPMSLVIHGMRRTFS